MPEKKAASAKQSKTEAKPPQKPTTILALKRPSPPPVVDKTPDEAIPPPITEDKLVSDDAASPLPVSQKPSIEVANSTELGRASDGEEVISPELATEDTVITKPAYDIKAKNSNGSSPVVDSVPKSNDSETKSNPDPLIGTFIEVLAPWGKNVSVF